MIDLVANFSKHEKVIARYVRERVDYYFKHPKCYPGLKTRIQRLNASWDMQIAAPKTNTMRNSSQQQFLAQLNYPLVKQQMLTRRAIFSNNFRSDPIFSLRAIGNTPEENAINMQDLLQGNNEQIQFRQKFLMPSINQVCRWGVNVAYVEYDQNQEFAWRTIADPILGSKRLYGPVKSTKNAVVCPIDPLNYFQNPDIPDSDQSPYRGHIDRWRMSQFINRVKNAPDVYIKENIEKVLKDVKKSNHLEDYYYDQQKGNGRHDYDKIMINDIIRGQFQIHIDGNEDDCTYYYIEMIGDTIVRFQDNPYDLNLNQYVVLTCEPRWDYWWGNTPAEYSIANENSLNMLLGVSLENTLESMRHYIFYNKNAIDPMLWQRAGSNAKIPVDVNKDVALNNIFFTYQVPDNSSQLVGQAYARILENDQRLASRPDLNRPTAMGGPSNKTATAALEMANKGDMMDADILEQYASRLELVGRAEVIILQQFLGNMGPIMIRPSNQQRTRTITKAGITGNFGFDMETALQKSYQGEMLRYQNVITWLLNLVNSGLPVQPNFEPLIKQVLKMGQFMKLDQVLPEGQMMNQPGYVPSANIPGQELAGPGQEVPPGMPEIEEQGEVEEEAMPMGAM